MSWGSLSEYAADLVVDDLRTHLWYVALSTGNPLAGGSIGELSGDGYARQAVTFAPASGGASTNSSLVQFVANGGDWSNPGQGWYISVWDSSSGGNLIAVVVGSAGWPVTTMADEVVAGGLDLIVDGATLRISPGVLRVAVVSGCASALDPVAEVLAMGPTLFWLFDRAEYNSVQLLFQDDAATTPVTANGQPVGCARDLVEGREFTQSTSGSRPEYGAGVGLIFDGTDDWLHGEDCSDLMAQTAQGDTKTVGFTVFSEADNTTPQRKFFGNDQPAQQAGLGVGDGSSPSQGGLISAGNGNLVVPYADFYQIKHGVIREFQNYGTVYGNNHAATFPQTSLILLDNPTLGRYNHSTASQYWLGNIGCCVMFDRVLNIPELAKLQQMLMRIGA